MMKGFLKILIFLYFSLFSISLNSQDHSIAREWNELLLESIRKDFARPTVHARNLFHLSAAMYDAWAVYDDEASPFFLGNTVGGHVFQLDDFTSTKSVEESRKEAISYAMYRLLTYRFSGSPNAVALRQMYNDFFDQLGYNKFYTNFNYTSGNPAALGNYIAREIINFGNNDGSNELNGFDNIFYQPVNPPLVIKNSGNPDIIDKNRWQPIAFQVFIDQSGNQIPGNIPDFLGPEWGRVVPFSLSINDLDINQKEGNNYWVYHDPGTPPLLPEIPLKDLDDEYRWGFSLVGMWSSHLSGTDTTMVDISPASLGNITEFPSNFEEYKAFYNITDGGDPGVGYDINPKTGQPYQPQLVKRGDYARILAEFWADGPDSETPPGHWFTLLNYINDHPQIEKKFKGDGDIIDNLEWDVKSYLLLGGTMHDVAVTSWGLKGYYDYIRPVSAIRAMAEAGQCTDENLPNYHPQGLPLIDGYYELVEDGDPLAGSNGQYVNQVKMKAWRGPDYINDPEIDDAEVGWILAKNWWPYQRPSFVTPPFAGFVSGHSTYSRAAAEVLTLLTGDPYFPGGMGEFVAQKNEFLVFEEGPTEDVVLQWAKYYDASDQCSLSRIWGGIHPPADDIPGRKIGELIGKEAFKFVIPYFYQDRDMDGFYSFEDCDDNDPNTYPGAPELCNGKDNNCNGLIDDGLTVFTYYFDNDSDGFGDSNNSLDTCLVFPPIGYVKNSNDCNDNDFAIRPTSIETCDGIDNNCNGLIDDGIELNTYYFDNDGDGFGNLAITKDTCLAVPPIGFVINNLDCDDDNFDINPSTSEICDGIDNDCNGLIDDGLPLYTYYRDFDNDGYGNPMDTKDTCITFPPIGYVIDNSDCNDFTFMINPSTSEICDGIDNDCNGLIDEELPLFTYYIDNDEDGYGNENYPKDTCISFPPMGYVDNFIDCNDNDANINPASEELCDGIDNNCSGTADDLEILFTYYRDEDNDGYGNPLNPLDTCLMVAPFTYVDNDLDCNDFNSNIYPTANDIPDNQIDEDCNGVDFYGEFKVFPTYVAQTIKVHFNRSNTEVKLLIFNNLGQIVLEKDALFIQNEEYIDVSELPIGLYHLNLIDNESNDNLSDGVFVKM